MQNNNCHFHRTCGNAQPKTQLNMNLKPQRESSGNWNIRMVTSVSHISDLITGFSFKEIWYGP